MRPIPFAEWRPDLADTTNPTADAKNVFPAPDGYRSIPSLTSITNALRYYCRGAFSAKSSGNTSYNYAGDGQNLYVLSNNTWSEANKAPGGNDVYSLGANESWEFVKWGENVIAVGGANATDPVPQIAALDGSDFADLGGTPPRARHIAVVRNFVVMGNLYESAAAYPNRIRWCGINDETNWAVDRAAQADYQDLQGKGGWVQAIRGGEYGVIFQENSIWLMEYAGPPEIFRFDERPGIGTPAPNSVIQRAESCYFYGNDGFYVTINGQRPEPIGRHILDKFVEADFDLNYPHRMVGGEDKANKVLWWIYPGVGNESGMPNKAVILDYQLGRWSPVEMDAEWIYDALGTSLDLDSFTAAGYADLDVDVPVSLDSNFWKGGSINLGLFCPLHCLNYLSGDAMTGTITTQERMLASPQRASVTRIRPILQGGDVTVKVGTRNDLSETVTWTDAISEARDGSVPCRSDARYHRFQVTNTGNFERALGILPLEVEPSGDY